MSAGQDQGAAHPDSDCGKLAPLFGRAVDAALLECRLAGLDAYVFEAYRSQALQSAYYARGRSVVPPQHPVTNAPSNLYSWHGYGLAVDVISRAQRWSAPESWFAQVAAIFKKHGCSWGGDWTQRDLPHFQWGLCKPSPSELAREIMSTQGVRAVWQALRADDSMAGSAITLPATATADRSAVAADIEGLQLNDNARSAAIILRARFPSLVFTSGRRSVRSQVHAMAQNIVKDRRFIAATYKPSALCRSCQAWVDTHPDACSAEAVAEGLSGVFAQAGESEVMAFSKHLTGDAFDLRPEDVNASVVVAFIRRLPLLEKFLDHEGQLRRWHLQFYR